MKNKIFIFIIMSMISNCVLSQTAPKNAVYYDFMGHTRANLSMNYERYLFKIYKDIHLNGRTGIGYYKYTDYYNFVAANAIIFPTVAVFEYGKKEHFFNISSGYSVSFIKDKKENNIPNFDSAYSFTSGYKYISETGWFFQIYAGKLYPKISSQEVTMGISIGGAW